MAERSGSSPNLWPHEIKPLAHRGRSGPGPAPGLELGTGIGTPRPAGGPGPGPNQEIPGPNPGKPRPGAERTNWPANPGAFVGTHHRRPTRVNSRNSTVRPVPLFDRPVPTRPGNHPAYPPGTGPPKSGPLVVAQLFPGAKNLPVPRTIILFNHVLSPVKSSSPLVCKHTDARARADGGAHI